MQQSLFGEPVKEKKSKIKIEEVEEADEDEDTEISTPSQIDNTEIQKHNELYDWSENCEKAQESIAYMLFEYHTNLANEYITQSDCLERFWKGAEEGYGGCWGGHNTIRDKDEVVALREEILTWKKEYLAIPYCRERADEWALRGIRKENIRVFINDQCKEFIERVGGWSVDDLQKELSELPEAELTLEYVTKVTEFAEVTAIYDKARTTYDTLRRKFLDLSDAKNTLISPEMVGQIYVDLLAAKKLQQESDVRKEQLRNEIGHYR
jgi:hypothetical protein